MEHDGRHFPNRIRKHRRMMGLTQKQVAKALGLESAYRISRWEKGDALPSVINLLKLSALFKTLSEDLYRDLSNEFRHSLYSKELIK